MQDLVVLSSSGLMKLAVRIQEAVLMGIGRFSKTIGSCHEYFINVLHLTSENEISEKIMYCF